MATPYIGLGMATSVNSTTIALIVNSTPPARERELVDVTALDSTLQIYLPGIEKHSAYTFDLLRDPDDTGQTTIYTLFGTKATIAFILTFTDTTASTWTFNGFISDIVHQQVEHNKPLMWRVTAQRNGAITVA